jgi:hypothetical protein
MRGRPDLDRRFNLHFSLTLSTVIGSAGSLLLAIVLLKAAFTGALSEAPGKALVILVFLLILAGGAVAGGLTLRGLSKRSLKAGAPPSE